MPPRTPAQARAAIDQQPFPNSAQERAAREEMERLITDLTAPVVRGAKDRMKAMNAEAGELAEAATAHIKAVNDLAARMQRREVSAKDARKERDLLRREEMKLSQLLDSITSSYESELYVRDHPEDTLNYLYERYPLERPMFPI
jgi:uncharacterized membrane protein YccC